MSGSKAASSCRAPSSSVALLLYSDASVLMLSLSCESFLGNGRYVDKENCRRVDAVTGRGIGRNSALMGDMRV